MTIDVTVALGVPGSASTWAFNIARELRLLEQDGKQVESFYCDAVARVWSVLQANQHLERKLVWKLHEPDEAWGRFLAENKVPLILSIRDPRDAMLSAMERFGETMLHAFERVSLAFRRVAESMRHDPLVLRYESKFFERPETVAALAWYLGLEITESDQARLFEAYRTEKVQLFADNLDALPAHRVRRVEQMLYDETTQIHRTHIGDQRIGKWRERLDKEQRRFVNAGFRRFLQTFEYDAE